MNQLIEGGNIFIFNEESAILNSAIHDVIEHLIAGLESKDIYTSGHSARVGDMSYLLGKKLGLAGIELEKVHIAAHLHDIGKIKIPASIIKKPGPLSRKEWEEIKRHPDYGHDILTQSRYLKTYAQIVRHHHERWDGNGYPAGLKGEEIPLGSRIIAICDTVDAMTFNRPYRKAFSLEETLREIKLNQGKQFDPAILEAAVEMWPLFEKQYGMPGSDLHKASDYLIENCTH